MCPDDRVKFDFKIENVSDFYFSKFFAHRILSTDRIRDLPLQLHHGTAPLQPQGVGGVSARRTCLAAKTLLARSLCVGAVLGLFGVAGVHVFGHNLAGLRNDVRGNARHSESTQVVAERWIGMKSISAHIE